MPRLIVLVGPPGSGKSTFAREYPVAYINQDSQGKEHLNLFHNYLANDKDIIVDRMGFSKTQRDRYLVPAKAAGYTTEIIVLHQPRSVCYKRCMERSSHETIKSSDDANNALNTFFGKYERPLEGEADSIRFIYPEGEKDLVIVCDLDGTLCNVDHRLHFVQRPKGVKKDWVSFFRGLCDDKPNLWCQMLVDSMAAQGTKVIFASGRPDNYRRDTERWLSEDGFSTEVLYMRTRNDSRQDYVAKEIILDFEILTRFKPLFFIDDRKQVVDLWRSRGFVCLACHHGEF